MNSEIDLKIIIKITIYPIVEIDRKFFLIESALNFHQTFVPEKQIYSITTIKKIVIKYENIVSS